MCVEPDVVHETRSIFGEMLECVSDLQSVLLRIKPFANVKFKTPTIFHFSQNSEIISVKCEHFKVQNFVQTLVQSLNLKVRN